MSGLVPDVSSTGGVRRHASRNGEIGRSADSLRPGGKQKPNSAGMMIRADRGPEGGNGRGSAGRRIGPSLANGWVGPD